MAASGSAANALPGGSFFELDGNAVDSNAAVNPPYDWSTLQAACDALSTPACPTGVAAATGIIRDLPADLTGADSTYFTGGGSKDDLDIPSWGTGGHGAPDKNELTNAYAAASRNTAGDLIVYFGADRYDTSGSAEMGFWLLKGTVRGNSGTFVDENHDPAVHQVGDVLVLTDFTNGGQLGEILVYQWVGPGGAGGTDGTGLSLKLLQKSVAPKPTKAVPNPANPADCTYTGSTPPANNDLACGVINRADTPAPWTYKNKDVAGDHTTTTFPALAFMEGAVNVGQLTHGQCFASFLAETRTAPEIQGAELKDYALGDFQPCLPSTTMKANAMTSNATNGLVHEGQNVTFTAFEKNDGTDPLTSPSVTGTGCTTWTKAGGDTDGNGKLDPGETWSFTCTTAFTGNLGNPDTRTVTVVGHGLDPRFNNKDVTVCPTPDSTKICDADETNNISVRVIHPSTTLTATPATVSPANGIAHIGDPVTFTFYEGNDGDVDLTSPHITTDDPNCLSISTPSGGDTNGDGILNPGETWAFQCLTSFNTSGVKTVTATGHGTDPLLLDITYPADAQERTSASITIINPGTILRESASAVVTFVYSENNAGDSNITNPNITSDCAGVGGHADPILGADSVHNVGDTGNDGVFAAGETWKFTCTTTVTIPAGSNTVSYTDNGAGHGTDAAGSPVKATNESDSSTVTVTNNTPN